MLSEDVAISRSHRAWTVGLTSLAFFMVALDLLVVITALPSMHRDFGGSLGLLAWTVNAYALAAAAGIITAAALGDRFGRRRMFVIGLSLFTAASAACALAPTVGFLIAARALQGLGAAIVMPLSLTILTAGFPAERRGFVVGVWGGIAGLAVASGPLIGGAVIQGLDWHWIFWINVPIGLAAIALSALRLSESRGPSTRIDPAAVTLVVGGSLGVVWALVRSSEAGWGSPEIFGSLAIGVVFLIAFVLWERMAAEPMLPVRLFRSLGFSAANLTSFLMQAALTAAVFLTAQYFQIVPGYSPLSTGLHILPWTAAPIVVAPIAGRLSDRIGRRPVMILGMVLQGLGLGSLALLATQHVSYFSLVLPLLAAGIGISMVLPTSATAALSSVAPRDMGKAAGVNNTLQRFGGAFGVAIVTAVFTAHGNLATAAGFDAGFRPALAVAATLSLLGAITALAAGVAVRPVMRGAVNEELT